MAEATKTGAQKRSVLGDLRYYGFDTVVFANTGDTFTTTLKHIESLTFIPTTNASYGFTYSVNSSGYAVATLVASAGLTFRGGAIGL